jgi:AcrR family transcriptional regulator
MKTKRAYTMVARADAVEATRLRILDSLFQLARTRMFPEIPLDDVAAEAEVSVQTILRQFGSRAELIEATMDYAIERVRLDRDAPAGDVDAAMRALLDHYEDRGKTALIMLAQETSHPQVERITEMGRHMHREWVEAVFAPFAPDAATTDLLVVATDVYTWKLLRRDRRLSRRATETRMKLLVRAVLDADHSKQGSA